MEEENLPETTAQGTEPQEDIKTQEPAPNKKRKTLFPIIITAFISIMLTTIYFTTQNSKTENTNQITPVEKIEKETIVVSEDQVQETPKEYYKIGDTGQNKCYSDKAVITCGSSFIGQDAQYTSNPPAYKDNEDGTITDLNTGLMWIKAAGEKQTYYKSIAAAENYTFAGYSDWRVPTIKELYTLMDFAGEDPPAELKSDANLKPFIDTNYFEFKYGNLEDGDRIIDSQWVTTSIYTGRVMNNEECFFGVNFADGRIKCYPTDDVKGKTYFMRLVRGESRDNEFIDSKDGTIMDTSTGLVWQKGDSGKGMDWESALNYCENLTLTGQTDWRVPNAKELQHIVDYSRGPDKTNSAAINPLFDVTSITNEMGTKDYPFYWTGTTHVNSNGNVSQAVYIAFGRALGKMNGKIMDVHGAGAQRSDPKSGDINDYPTYFGPQGDVRRLHNYVRCVRG